MTSRRLIGALTLLALVAAVFASAPAIAANDCCGKACFCRHESAAARGASCALRKGNPCGVRHPLPAARASAPERPALPFERAASFLPPLEPSILRGPRFEPGASAPPNDPATPPPRLLSSVAA